MEGTLEWSGKEQAAWILEKDGPVARYADEMSRWHRHWHRSFAEGDHLGHGGTRTHETGESGSRQSLNVAVRDENLGMECTGHF